MDYGGPGAALVFVARKPSRKLLDSALGFAAGVMVFVVVEELIPASQRNGNADWATTGAVLGLVIMTALHLAFA